MMHAIVLAACVVVYITILQSVIIIEPPKNCALCILAEIVL